MNKAKEILDKHSSRNERVEFGEFGVMVKMPDAIRAIEEALKQVKNNDLLHSVSHCSKGILAEEFQKGYKEGYEDGANAAANDIAANPHKMY